MKKILNSIIYLLILFNCNVLIFGQSLCGGSFGDPVFIEDFGASTNSNFTISGPLTSPAYTSYTHTYTYPPNDGFYSIVNRSGVTNGWSWVNVSDHTTDGQGKTGNMLIVNASYTAGEFYRRRVSNLCPNQVYRFSAWLINLIIPNSNQIKPDVTFQIRDVAGKILGEVNTGEIAETGSWKNYFLDFRASASSGEVDVVLINNAAGGIGNDIAIDDITFSPCGSKVESVVNSNVIKGVCDNSNSFVIDAKIEKDTYSNPFFIFQKSNDNGNTWIDLTTPTSLSQYQVKASSYFDNEWYRFIVAESNNINSQNCRIASEPIKIKINGYPSAPDLSTFIFCEGGSNTYNIPNNLIWYESQNDLNGKQINPIINTYQVGIKSYWVSQVVNGCESSRIKVDFIVKQKTLQPVVSDVSLCQDQKATNLVANGNNLIWYSSEFSDDGTNVAPIPDTSIMGIKSYWVSQIIDGCESERAEIKVTILEKPLSIFLNDISICDNEVKRLDAGPGFSSYKWNTNPPIYSRYLDITQPGKYSITLTNSNGCENIQQINVSAGDVPLIKNIVSGKDFIDVVVEGGNPPYLYSLNGKDWQENSVFENLSFGEYEVFVKSKYNSCIAFGRTAVLFIPNVITPNRDGINDVFDIPLINYFPNAKMIIYDRYGKLVFSSKNNGTLIWDGLYNNQSLPTGTYWYQLELDEGNFRSGWILLKNRD